MVSKEAKSREIESIGDSLPQTYHKTVYEYLRQNDIPYDRVGKKVTVALNDLPDAALEGLYSFLKTFQKNRSQTLLSNLE